jgi:hypothetical protein
VATVERVLSSNNVGLFDRSSYDPLNKVGNPDRLEYDTAAHLTADELDSYVSACPFDGVPTVPDLILKTVLPPLPNTVDLKFTSVQYTWLVKTSP